MGKRHSTLARKGAKDTLTSTGQMIDEMNAVIAQGKRSIYFQGAEVSCIDGEERTIEFFDKFFPVVHLSRQEIRDMYKENMEVE